MRLYVGSKVKGRVEDGSKGSFLHDGEMTQLKMISNTAEVHIDTLLVTE